MKRGTPQHRKMHLLAESLKQPLYSAVGIMEMLWHFVGQNAPRGDIGSVPDRQIAAAVAWDGKADKLIDGLVSSVWLDRHEEYRLVVHDWPEHCEQSVRKWLLRNKKNFLPVYGNYSPAVQPASGHEDTFLSVSVHPSREEKAMAKALDQSSETLNPEGFLSDFTPKELAGKLWKIHPSPSKIGFVESSLFNEMSKSIKPPVEFAASITQSLEAWAAYWLASGRMATGLDNWIASGDYALAPPPLAETKEKAKFSRLTGV